MKRAMWLIVWAAPVAVALGGCPVGRDGGADVEGQVAGNLAKPPAETTGPGSDGTGPRGLNQAPTPSETQRGEGGSVAGLINDAWALYQAGQRESDGGFDEGKLNQACDLFSQAIEAEPDLVEAYIGRGRVNLEIAQTWVMEDYQKADPAIQQAFDDFTYATKLDSESVDAWMGLGQVYMCSGDWSAATEQFDEVLRLDPNNAEAKRYVQECLNELDNMADDANRRY